MEDGISIRYYRVERADKTHPRFADRLKHIRDLGGPAKRQQDIGGIKIRLERLEEPSPRFFEGEFVRLQERAYPSEVHEDKVAALGTARPLGHHLAFVFNEAKGVLAAQYDMRALPISRVNRYLGQFPPNNMYLFTPLVRKDSWDRFVSAPTRSVRFMVASPANLKSVDSEHKAVFENVSEIAEEYCPHLMEINMSMGKKKGALNQATDLAKTLLRLNDEGDIDLRKLKGKVEEQEEDINLLEEVLTEKITLDLPRNDPEKSYEMRREALRAGMTRNAKVF